MSPPPRPIVAVGGIVFDAAGRVLVIQRAHPPSQGCYTLPGGKVELGESLAAACAREVREETGLVIEVGPLVELVEKVGRDEDGAIAFHFVIADYLCTLVGGTLAHSDECLDARFAPRAELDRLPVTELLRPVVDKARAMRGR